MTPDALHEWEHHMTPPLVTWLYCAGSSSPQRLRNAIVVGPDAVIYDLEDSVDPAGKDRARRDVAAHLSHLDADDVGMPHIQVRVNALGSPWFEDDVRMVNESSTIQSIRVPKVDSADDMSIIAGKLDPRLTIHALIETANGVENMREICRFPRVTSVSLGEADIRAELSSDSIELINYIRCGLVIASAAAGIAAPMGAAFLDLHDESRLVEDTRQLAQLGFFGRTAIHPSQLPGIRHAFRPDEDEFQRACSILASVQRESGEFDLGASSLTDGTFVDRPVVIRAQRIVAAWRATESPRDTHE